MGIHSTPVSQIGETSATESVELNTVQLTPISTQYENKTEDVYKRQDVYSVSLTAK